LPATKFEEELRLHDGLSLLRIKVEEPTTEINDNGNGNVKKIPLLSP
jgi:hypothetical protein